MYENFKVSKKSLKCLKLNRLFAGNEIISFSHLKVKHRKKQLFVDTSIEKVHSKIISANYKKRNGEKLKTKTFYFFPQN